MAFTSPLTMWATIAFAELHNWKENFLMSSGLEAGGRNLNTRSAKRSGLMFISAYKSWGGSTETPN